MLSIWSGPKFFRVQMGYVMSCSVSFITDMQKAPFSHCKGIQPQAEENPSSEARLSPTRWHFTNTCTLSV